MSQNGHWVQKLADGADLHGEPLPGVPVIEIAGDHRVLIERHKGVIEYGTERIRVRVRYGVVCISGCGLELTLMTNQQLIISGQINAVTLQRRCR